MNGIIIQGGFWNIRSLMGIFPIKEMTCDTSQGNSVLRYYKNLKTLRKQVSIIYPIFDILEL